MCHCATTRLSAISLTLAMWACSQTMGQERKPDTTRVNVGNARETVIEGTRVGLLRVSQVIDYTLGGVKTPNARSFEVWFFMEKLDPTKPLLEPIRIDAYVLNRVTSTTRLLGSTQGPMISWSYADYEKLALGGLPVVRAKNSTAFFKAASGLKSEIETIDVREGGVMDVTFRLKGVAKTVPIVQFKFGDGK